MSKIGVSLKIDVSKIDKQLLFKGQKGIYLDAKVFIDIDQKDQYDNNGMITQELGKNAQQGDQGVILGNCRVFWKEPVNEQMPSQQLAQKQNQAQGGFSQQAPQQQGGFQQGQQQFAQQQATQQGQSTPDYGIDFDDDIPF